MKFEIKDIINKDPVKIYRWNLNTFDTVLIKPFVPYIIRIKKK